VHLLGPFRVSLDGEPTIDFVSDKARALLAYLAVESDQPHRREALAGLLWPDYPERSARASLRTALANVRQVIGDRTAKPPFLCVLRQTVQFNPEGDAWVDVTAFTQLLKKQSALMANRQTIHRLQKAVELYQGDFLTGFSLADSAAFEEWALLTREQLRRQALTALQHLVEHCEEEDESQRGLEYAWRQVEMDPLREGAQRQLMRLLALNGQWEAALAQYEGYHRLLETELGVAPSPEIQETFELLLMGELPSKPPTVIRVLEREPRDVGACPYLGLAPFREADAPFFFGRDGFTKKLIEAVRERPLVAVIVGSSGSGKSSAVFAGLVPRLRSEGDWLMADLRPGGQPFHALAAALLDNLEPELSEAERLDGIGELAATLSEGDVPLLDVVERALERSPGARRALLLVDQFEELYTLCPEPETRRRFVDVLLAAVRAAEGRGELAFVLSLTLRADFMGQALAHRPFADALQEASLMLGPMTRDELQAAIERPAEKQGAAFEAGLVERVLDDVGEEPGNLPLLEFALTLLWERLDHGWMTHAAYEEIGQVEGALARYAEQVFDELDADAREGVRQVLVQLVQPGEGTKDTRRVTAKGELGEESWGLVQHLADRRLVVTGREPSTGVETVEVVHEALIQGWGRLRGWMEADRAFRTWQERLRVALRGWETSERDEGALLRGAPLAEAEGWLAERRAELSPAEEGFIHASVALREQRRAERDRRRRHTILALAGGLVVAVVLALLAGGQWQRAEGEVDARATAQAESETTEHEAQRQAAILLAAQAESELEDGFADRAVLLALEALEHYPYTPQAEHALGQAVSYNRALQQYTGHESAVTSVAWSPDGTRIASSSTDNSVHVWDASTGEELLVIDLPEGITGNIFDWALSVKWSPDGGNLLTVSGDRFLLGSQDYDITLWDARSGEQVVAIELPNQAEPEAGEGVSTNFYHYATAAAAAFAPKGGRLATIGGDNTAIVWDTSLQTQELVLTGHENDVNGVAWSPDEAHLATASEDGTARIWDAQTGEELLVLRGHEGAVNVVVWSPDGAQLATAGDDGTVRFWDAETSEVVRTMEPNAGIVWSLAWSPDGSQLATGTDDACIRIWEIVSGEVVAELNGHGNFVAHLAWSPVDDRLASAGAGGTVRTWNGAPSTAALPLPYRVVPGLSWSSDGRYVVVAGGDLFGETEPPILEIWDVSTGQPVVEDLGAGLCPDCTFWGQADYSPDERLLLVRGGGWPPDASVTTKAYVIDALTGELVTSFTATDGSWMLRDVDWSPDGAQVSGGTNYGTVFIWDLQTGDPLHTMVHRDGVWVMSVDWSPDGTKIASAGGEDANGKGDGTVQVWDAATGEALFALTGEPGAYLWKVAWSPDGTRILTTSGSDEYGSKDTTIRVWDANTGEELLVIDRHAGQVTWGSWSPDGTRIVSGSSDNTTRIWDATTGAELLSLSTPTMWAVTSKWSPDGKFVAVGKDGTPAEVWRVWQSTEELVAYAKACCVFRELTPDERVQFGLSP
jgi:WD40 repeat protein/DNA-binding SARP family transcriptional activator